MPPKPHSGSGIHAKYSVVDETGGRFSGDSLTENATEFSRFDFNSPEFNFIDKLDDNTGDYRSFQSLAGIVTSDMRHHRERKRLERLPPAITKEETVLEEEERSVAEEPKNKDLPLLTMVSRGRLLIVDTDLNRALNCAERLDSRGLICTLCVPSRNSIGLSVTQIDSFAFVETDAVAITGCFCGFTAAVTGVDGSSVNLSALVRHLSSLTGQNNSYFDLVLDLQLSPSYTGHQLPVGYYAPGEDSVLLETALAELPEMRGRFKKPQFTVLQENRCLHGRSRHYSCLRCLKICPVSAIKQDNYALTIDQYRCQGCGACALVCPADAIQRMNPPPDELLTDLCRLISEFHVKSSSPPDVIFYDQSIDEGIPKGRFHPDSDKTIVLQVEDVAHIGLEVVLVAMAYGAGNVTLVCDPKRPSRIREALERQIQLGAAILQGLDFTTDLLRFTDTFLGESDWETVSTAEKKIRRNYGSVDSPIGFGVQHDKRTLIRLAAEQLSRFSDVPQTFVSLPAGVPFGTITINDSCSLCMACVSACPSDALQAGGDLPRLSIVESNCHQCGFCAAACPEDAIQLQPGLLCDLEAANSSALLREVEPFKCIECGEPFASLAMVDRMRKKLEGHWMYSSDQQVRRLQMCRTCRTRDALTVGDYRS